MLAAAVLRVGVLHPVLHAVLYAVELLLIAGRPDWSDFCLPGTAPGCGTGPMNGREN
jgi:hypothetical protein